MEIENTPPSLILASASPRRRELLKLLGRPFDTLIPEIDETPKPGEQPQVFAERLASEKADAVSAEGILITADTIVVRDQTILGKPVDSEHARDMLTSLSGRAHEVITAVCVKHDQRKIVFSVSTRVVFRDVSSAEINAYIETGEPMDKAGAYAIQGAAAHMVRAIEGSYTNVVGLPMCELHEALLSF